MVDGRFSLGGIVKSEGSQASTPSLTEDNDDPPEPEAHNNAGPQEGLYVALTPNPFERPVIQPAAHPAPRSSGPFGLWSQ